MIVPGKHDTFWAYLIGTGVALSPIHNLWLTRLTTNEDGQVWFFLPQFGYLLLILGSALFLVRNWDRVREAGLGDRRLVWGLAFVIGAIALSGTAYSDWPSRLAPFGTGLAFFGLYLAGRVIGSKSYTPVGGVTLLASVGVILHAVFYPGELTGGFVFERNYDIVVGYILLGAALYSGRFRLPLIALSLVAVFLTGSPEGIWSVFILGVVVLLRKDWGRPLLFVSVPLVAVVALWFGVGWGQDLYGYAFDILQGEKTVAYVPAPEPLPEATESTQGGDTVKDVVYIRRDSNDPPVVGERRENPLTDRINVIRTEMESVEPLGDGYNLTEFRTDTVHNVPLIIVQQLGWPGIAAGVVWVVVGIAGWRVRRWRYAWTLMFALSVFDHFTWTQMAPYWWLLVGVGFSDTRGVDHISGD